MQIPTLEIAEAMLAEAEQLNPGPWVMHSRNAGLAARTIAAHHPNLDPEAAYILGTLHDIGRRVGRTDMRHAIDGYHFLHQQGYEDAARISLTHSFPLKNAPAAAGKWDCTEAELRFVEDYLAAVEYNTYDGLIQLCDSIALPGGICLLEKRMVDVALRYGTNAYTIDKWKAFFALQERFSREIGQSIYAVLPGVVETTFGF